MEASIFDHSGWDETWHATPVNFCLKCRSWFYGAECPKCPKEARCPKCGRELNCEDCDAVP